MFIQSGEHLQSSSLSTMVIRLSFHLVPWHNALVMHLLLLTVLRQISIVQSFGCCTKNPEDAKMQADDVASRSYGSGMSSNQAAVSLENSPALQSSIYYVTGVQLHSRTASRCSRAPTAAAHEQLQTLPFKMVKGKFK